MLAYRLVVGNVFRALADPTRRVILDEPRERASVLVDDQHKALRFCTEVLGFVKNTEIPLGAQLPATTSSPTAEPPSRRARSSS